MLKQCIGTSSIRIRLPILIVDGSGSVIEANASAQRVFDATTAQVRPSPDR